MAAPLLPDPWKASTIGSRCPAAAPGGTWTSAERRRPPLCNVMATVSETGATRQPLVPATAREGVATAVPRMARATAARPVPRRALRLTAGRLVPGRVARAVLAGLARPRRRRGER